MTPRAHLFATSITATAASGHPVHLAGTPKTRPRKGSIFGRFSAGGCVAQKHTAAVVNATISGTSRVLDRCEMPQGVPFGPTFGTPGTPRRPVNADL